MRWASATSAERQVMSVVEGLTETPCYARSRPSLIRAGSEGTQKSATIARCLDLVVGAGRRRFDVDDDRVLDIGEVIGPIAQLHALVALAVRAEEGRRVAASFRYPYSSLSRID